MLLLVLISFASTANGFDYNKRCLLFRGRCGRNFLVSGPAVPRHSGFYCDASTCELCVSLKGVNHCPRDMHPYHTRCDRDTMSQRTCDSAEVQVLGYTCGWSRCDCNGDLVLNEVTGECGDLTKCPTTTHKERKRGARKLKRKERPKMKNKIRFSEGMLPDIE